MSQILKPRRLAILSLFFCFFVTFLYPVQAENDTLTVKVAPPLDLEVKDTPDDGGGNLNLYWKPSPDDREEIGDIDGYEIFRASRKDTTLKLVTLVSDNTTSFTDIGLESKGEYFYAIRAKKGNSYSPLVYSNFALPRINWFRTTRVNMLVLLLIFSASVLLYIRSAKGGKSLFIRKLAGLEAMEEAVGRATEMGKPVLFIPGISDLDEIQTIAGLSILGKV
ncbi:MAG: fibronectin type III domain-containing protein, partial [candidate division Zixibacteria bacterium]|nr:fibronectin type III domain-containing protein [candidate division Zixibacteria bacterium]